MHTAYESLASGSVSPRKNHKKFGLTAETGDRGIEIPVARQRFIALVRSEL